MTLYCIKCGGPLPADALFCRQCGARQPISPTPSGQAVGTPPPHAYSGVAQAPVYPQQQQQIQWEEMEFVYEWPPERAPWQRMSYGNARFSDATTQVSLWYKAQADVLPELQRWYDEGWEALTEVGPGGLVTRSYVSLAREPKPYVIAGMFLLLAFLLTSGFRYASSYLSVIILLFLVLFVLARYMEAEAFRVRLRRRRS